MSLDESGIAPGFWAWLDGANGGAQPATSANSMSSSRFQAMRYAVGVHGSVVAQVEQADGVDLEVEVIRRAFRVTRVAHEAEDGASLDVGAVHGRRREGGEMRVVELVPLAVA